MTTQFALVHISWFTIHRKTAKRNTTLALTQNVNIVMLDTEYGVPVIVLPTMFKPGGNLPEMTLNVTPLTYPLINGKALLKIACSWNVPNA